MGWYIRLCRLARFLPLCKWRWLYVCITLELIQYFRFRRKLRYLEMIRPTQAFPALADGPFSDQCRAFSALQMENEPRPFETICDSFSIDILDIDIKKKSMSMARDAATTPTSTTSDDDDGPCHVIGGERISIPRDSVLRFLRYYLSMKEERPVRGASAASNDPNFPHARCLLVAAERNGGAEDDLHYVWRCKTAQRILGIWEARSPALRQVLSNRSWDELRTAQNPLIFVRVGASPLMPMYKPILVKATIGFVRFALCHVALRLAGFSRHLGAHGIIFWTRMGHYSAAPPLFFLHGAGMGIVPYLHKLLREVGRRPGRTYVFPEWPCLSHGTWRDHFPNPRELAGVLHVYLRRTLNCRGAADVLSHSFGTIFLTYWLRYYPQDVRRRVYIDPVCVGPTFSKSLRLAYQPRFASLGRLIHESPNFWSDWFVMSDIGFQHLCKRNSYASEFYEKDMTKWNADALVILSENDDVVDAHSVQHWLRKHGDGVQLAIISGWSHGACVKGADVSGVWSRLWDFVNGDIYRGGGLSRTVDIHEFSHKPAHTTL